MTRLCERGRLVCSQTVPIVVLVEEKRRFQPLPLTQGAKQRHMDAADRLARARCQTETRENLQRGPAGTSC